jgi:hypothetical protein
VRLRAQKTIAVGDKAISSFKSIKKATRKWLDFEVLFGLKIFGDNQFWVH